MKLSVYRRLALSTVVVSALIPGPSRGQNPDVRSRILVTTEWLGEHLRDPNLVVLHVGPRREYDEAHIPGARFVDLDDIADSQHEGPGALMLQVPSPESLRAKLAGLGIANDSRIVVAYHDDWFTPATRVVFTLDYAGMGDRTSLLDGGMLAWKSEKRPVTRDVPARRTGELAALKTKPIVVDGDFVRANSGKPGVSVVDGRASVFYDGVETGRGHHSPHKRGHIAGAKSVPFTAVTDERMKLKPAAELAAVFAKAGVKPGDTIVGYCHIGQQATGMLFAARSLGYKVLLYDGSFEDWSARADGPVETTARR
jgi:thiosulfate/3-mercaptopyruvate sulfurtransferase